MSPLLALTWAALVALALYLLWMRNEQRERLAALELWQDRYEAAAEERACVLPHPALRICQPSLN